MDPCLCQCRLYLLTYPIIRGFVVALAAVLGLDEADATAAMDMLVATSLKSNLLSVAADLRQVKGYGPISAVSLSH